MLYYMDKCCPTCKRPFVNRNPTVWYKGRNKRLNFDPRKHVCSQCGKVGTTHLHHIQYDDNDPLANTVELCASCHLKTHYHKIHMPLSEAVKNYFHTGDIPRYRYRRILS